MALSIGETMIAPLLINPEPGEETMDEVTALTRTIAPVRQFMSQQIDKAGNADAIWMLHSEGVQDRPSAGVANQNRFRHRQGRDHVQDVVGTPLRVVPGRGVLRTGRPYVAERNPTVGWVQAAKPEEPGISSSQCL